MTDHANDAAAVFDARVETAAAEAQYRPFPFIGLDGQDYQLPHPLMLSSVEQRYLSDLEAAGKDPTEFLAKFFPAVWGAIEKMPAAVQASLMRTWAEQVGATEMVEDTPADDPGK